jgi:hypothetical protein
MKILALAGDIGALIADIRLRTPLQALSARQGWPLVMRSLHDCTRAELADCEVLVMQRPTSLRALRMQQAVRQRGAAVVVEIDDLLTGLPAHISNQAAVRAAQGPLRACLGEADMVAVSTARLGAELTRELGLREVCVVPNCALSLGDTPLPQALPGAPVTLLFASMDRLAAGFLMPALQALQALQGPGLRLCAVGPAGEALAATGLPVERHGVMPRAEFLSLARGLGNPIAVIPLEDSRFAACKSAIKWFDYGEAGIPVLCSRVSPYAGVVDDGVTGRLVDNTPAAWQAALAAAASDATWRNDVAQAARAVVRERHTLAHSVDAWEAALRLALQRRVAAPPPSRGPLWHLRDAVAAGFEGAVLRLRHFNRQRLARRKSAR